MTKFNPEQWSKVKANTLAACPSRKLVINLVDQGALWIVDGKTETLAGYGHSFKLDLPRGGMQYKVTVDGFVFAPKHKPHVNDAPTLTNLEKRAEMSPAEILVTRALREMKRKERELEKRIKEANAAQIAKQQGAAAVPIADPEVSEVEAEVVETVEAETEEEVVSKPPETPEG